MQATSDATSAVRADPGQAERRQIKTMRVIYDSQIFCAQQYGGISRYFASVARELAVTPGVSPRIVAPLHINAHLDGLAKGVVVGINLRARRLGGLWLGMTNSLFDHNYGSAFRPDVVHRTYYYPQLRRRPHAPTVVTVHDMTCERYPQSFRQGEWLRRWKRDAVMRADHVICISENTRRDLLEHYDVREEKVSVTLLGYDPIRPNGASGLEKLSTSFILYVGARTGYKNFRRLLMAFGSSQWLHSNFSLVCFGAGEFTGEERRLIARNGLAGRVSRIVGSDSTLATAYQRAQLLVYPSLNEGFGLPPLEAMSLDCPVACSNTSSIPEIVGDAAAFFDPCDVDDIRQTMEKVLGSPAERHALIQRGRERVRLFSWKRCATETMNVYAELCA